MDRVTATQFVKTPGLYQDRALREPVIITKHNREHTVLLSAEEYHRLKRRDRQAVRIEDLSEADIRAIRAIEPPPESYAFDDEVDGNSA